MIRKGQRPRISRVGALLLGLVALIPARAAEVYYPGAGEQWDKRAPDAAGMDPDKLAAAVKFAEAHEVNWLRDVRAQIESDVAKEPYPQVLGETKERGRPAGMIVRHGYIVAEWGDVNRVDMSFSVAKSYLSTVAGLAIDRGLIKDAKDPLWKYVEDGGFDSPHNSKITWHMMLNQTSEWEGVLWDKPDVADRRRGYGRRLEEPGTFWEYNDVRVNRLALSLLRVWNKPLPQVLKESIMDPIGASDTWVWHGYRNSYIRLDGRAVQSVSGGSHWGGGLWASTRDHARFGYLLLRNGTWSGRQIISERWVQMATTPTDVAPQYGYLWWLNTGRRTVPSAPESSFFALGSGGNVIWIDRDHDLVVVTRWLDFGQLEAFAKLVQESVKSEQ
jgi:CubicO group peptidase (beta-lactamase class C family)